MIASIIVSLLLVFIFIFADVIAKRISAFWAAYPLVRLLPMSQHQLRPTLVRFASAILFCAVILATIFS